MEKVFEKTVAMADSFLEMGIPGYDLWVLKDGKRLLRRQNGYEELETGTPVGGDKRYCLYSCSKLITCAAALQLMERGHFSLEDTLSEYLPEFADMTVRTNGGIEKAREPIRIRHLFEMTAGFSYNLRSPQLERARRETGGRCTTRETMRYLAKEPLCFHPGDEYRYSLCHDVLAALVEVVSGMRFSDYVKEHIFTPLGMTRSTFRMTQQELSGVMPQYRFDAETKTAVRCEQGIGDFQFGTEYESGGAGCIAPVEDYVKLLEAIRAGETVLRRGTVERMITDRLNDRQRPFYEAMQPYAVNCYGYGLGVRCPSAGSKMFDFGWGGAAGSFYAVDILHGITVFYAQSMLNSPNKNLRIRLCQQAIEEAIEMEEA